MRVEGPRSNAPTAKSKAKGQAGSTFSLQQQDESSASTGTSNAQEMTAVTGLDAILALQSVESGEDRSRRAVQHGHDMLDQLETLRADLLAGRVSPQRLASLLALLRAKQSPDNEQLASLINDIDLRARVELAKLGVDV